MKLSKPEKVKRKAGAIKRVGVGFSEAQLVAASEGARYIGSPYHRMHGSLMGPAVARRYPHASKCPITWTFETANRALKDAIRKGHVSQDWDGGFPLWVWYKAAETLYEARLSNRDQGAYHAYPLAEEREWPVNLQH
jgi:hypothetical protein